MGKAVRRVGAWFPFPVLWLYNRAYNNGFELFSKQKSALLRITRSQTYTPCSPTSSQWPLRHCQRTSGPCGALKSTWRNSWTQEALSPARIVFCRPRQQGVAPLGHPAFAGALATLLGASCCCWITGCGRRCLFRFLPCGSKKSCEALRLMKGWRKVS